MSESLFTLYPHLKQYWSIDNKVDMDSVLAGTRREILFTCDSGHTVNVVPRNIHRSKSKDFKCSQCHKKEVRYLFKERPDLLNLFDDGKNKIDPLKITTGRKKPIYLRCEKGHSFKRSACKLLIHKNIQCPVCSGVEVVDETRLDLNYPDIAAEWDYDKNKGVRPSDVSYLSNKRYWWVCSEGHSYKEGVSNRTGHRYKNKEQTKCKYCYSPSVSRNETIICAEMSYFFSDVRQSYRCFGKEIDIYIPELSLGIEYDGERWHKNKYKSDTYKNKIFKDKGINILRIRESDLNKINKDDYIYDVSESIFNAIEYLLLYIKSNYGLKKELIIKIDEYIRDRRVVNIDKFKNLMDSKKIKRITNPLLIKEFSKDNELPLFYYGAGSDYMATWECSSCGNKWQQKIRNRVGGSGCLCKSNKGMTSSEVFDKYPVLRSELINRSDYNFKDIGKKEILLWRCLKCSTVYKSSIKNRLNGKLGCSNCGYHIIYDTNKSFLKIRPELKKYWSKTNGELNPDFLTIDYPFKVDWACEKGHITKEMIKSKIEKNRGCLICEKEMTVYQLKRVEKEWDYKKNTSFNPKLLKMNSNKKVWWKCSVSSDHVWQSEIQNRLIRGCPYCSNRKGFLSKTNRLDIIHPEIAIEWDYQKNTDNPSDHNIKSGAKRHWCCTVCGHKFLKKICDMVDTAGFCQECKNKK